MRLDALHEVGEVFTGAERALADDFLEDAEGIGFFLEEGRELWRVAAASCTADFLDIDFDVVHHGRSLEDALGFRLHERIDRARRTARLEAHKGLVADDVAAAARVEPADIDARSAGGMARDGVQVERGAGSGQQRVLALFWRSAGVCRDALEVRVVLARRKEARDVAGDGARLAHLEAEVRAEHVVDIVDDAALNHRMRTAHAFLCWLEAELDRAAQLRLEAGQQSGKSESDGRVAVVTAGVHGARMAGGKALLVGAVRSFRRLRHIIGVHVEAHGDDRTVC